MNPEGDDMKKAKFGEVYEFILPTAHPDLDRVMFIRMGLDGMCWVGINLKRPEQNMLDWSIRPWKKVKE